VPGPAGPDGSMRAASSGTIAAELAGWAAGELPGQASARLAAWATVGGVPADRRPGPGPMMGGGGEAGLGR
jgi:hypothetical protein